MASENQLAVGETRIFSHCEIRAADAAVWDESFTKTVKVRILFVVFIFSQIQQKLSPFSPNNRNMFPDNIFQAAFQSAYTSYAPRAQSTLFTFNGTEEVDLHEQQEVVRVLQYRSGTNTLGIVFFCLTFGMILGTIGEKGQVVVNFFSAIFEVIMKMVILVCLWLSPFGISSVIAGKILDVDDLGLILSQLLMFIVTVAVGVFFYQLVVLQTIYFAIIRKNPFKFYAGLFPSILYSFATASK